MENAQSTAKQGAGSSSPDEKADSHVTKDSLQNDSYDGEGNVKPSRVVELLGPTSRDLLSEIAKKYDPKNQTHVLIHDLLMVQQNKEQADEIVKKDTINREFKKLTKDGTYDTLFKEGALDQRTYEGINSYLKKRNANLAARLDRQQTPDEATNDLLLSTLFSTQRFASAINNNKAEKRKTDEMKNQALEEGKQAKFLEAIVYGTGVSSSVKNPRSSHENENVKRRKVGFDAERKANEDRSTNESNFDSKSPSTRNDYSVDDIVSLFGSKRD